jgi:hypothetical protein
MLISKKRLKQHFTNAVKLHNWTMKLGVLEGLKGYFCVILNVEFEEPFNNFLPLEPYLNWLKWGFACSKTYSLTVKIIFRLWSRPATKVLKNHTKLLQMLILWFNKTNFWFFLMVRLWKYKILWTSKKNNSKMSTYFSEWFKNGIYFWHRIYYWHHTSIPC